MKYSETVWIEKRNKGLKRYLMFDGILFTGGPFAVVMQAVGYFILAGETETFGQYFGAARTWSTFFFHATLFGLIMGFVNWRRNEKAFANRNVNEQDVA